MEFCNNRSNKVVVGHYLDESKEITLHQPFVTVSPKLCYAVKCHICQPISFARENYSGTGSMNSIGVDDIGDMADFKDIPDTFVGFPQAKQSVLDLICRYFPDSIDSLPPETNRVYGESSVVLKPECNENSIISIFVKSAKGGQKSCAGFGAGQVTLVRDYFARSGWLLALFLATVEFKGLEFQENLFVSSGSPDNLNQDSSSKPNIGPIPAMFLSSMNSDESLVFFPASERTYNLTFDINLREYDIVGQSMPTHGSWLVLARLHSREIFFYNGRRRIDLPDLPTQPETIFTRASFVGDPDRGCHVLWMEFYVDYFVTRIFDPAHGGAWGEQVEWHHEVNPMGMITTREGYSWVDSHSGDLWLLKNYWEVPTVELVRGLIEVEVGVLRSICSLLDDEDRLAGFVVIISNEDDDVEWEEVIQIYSLVHEEGGMAAAETLVRVVPFRWFPGQNIYCSVYGPGLIKTEITYTQGSQLYLGSYDHDDCVVFNGEGGRVRFQDGNHRFVLRPCYSPDVNDNICDCRVIILSVDESDFPQ